MHTSGTRGLRAISPKIARKATYSFVAVAGALAWGHYFNGWPCPMITAGNLEHVRLYLKDYYGLASSDDLRIEAVSTVRESCLTRLKVSGPLLQRPATWFLSDDHRYIMPSVADLSRPMASRPKLSEIDIQTLQQQGSAPSIGAKDARVVAVEFSDFECSYCKRLTDALQRNLSQSALQHVRLVFRNFPLAVHAHSRGAAELGACIGRQDNRAFWKFHDHIFEDQERLASPTFVQDSVSFIGAEFPSLDLSTLRRCIASRDSGPDVERDIELGRRFAVSGTPTLFINGTRLVGARDSAFIRRVISLEEQREARSAVGNSDPKEIPPAE